VAVPKERQRYTDVGHCFSLAVARLADAGLFVAAVFLP
jgi:hypothetical protein